LTNFDSARVKVNDLNGNPVEIAAVVVWRVTDTASAVFDVQNYHEYVRVQSETAVRHLATSYPYDSQEENGLSLSGTVDEVSGALQVELSERLKAAGVEVIEARLSHLAYAPEIAAVMLRRQQAAAVVAARQQMVAGAVGMVELALQELERGGTVQLDPTQKSRLVSNLLVVLTSEQSTTPIVNAEG
jgi:regulator of protease activity HflC (stomatin/prohibitin superfamily)